MSGRRTFIQKTAAITSGTILPGAIRDPSKKQDTLKILVTGGHPDDPETGAGGTIRRLTDAGHQVNILYLTRGEAGITGTAHQDAAAIREKEAIEACAILGAKPLFLGQIDGATLVTNEWYTKILAMIWEIQPHALFTHWPVDTHRDHRHCSLLTYDAWLSSDRKAAFYYYEVVSGYQTMSFRPTHYVDITTVAQQKRDACFSHKSQKIKESYLQHHGKMEDFRGRENNCQYAEAFIHLDSSPQIELPA
jgi:LmbE family N-acetylglucosaminyl deacetylase